MGKEDRRVYAPPGYVLVTEEEDAPPRRQALVFTLMFAVVVAFSGFVWNVYSGAEPPRIRAPAGDYKVRPPPGADAEADAPEENTLYDALEGRPESAQVAAQPGPEEPLTMQQQNTPRRPSPPPRFSGNGPYVAQIAAIQSEAAVEESWRRIAARAPSLFAGARLDVERADLGARGIYYRVRAGYFADRANAASFCDRIKAMGQDCIVAAR